MPILGFLLQDNEKELYQAMKETDGPLYLIRKDEVNKPENIRLKGAFEMLYKHGANVNATLAPKPLAR